MATRYKEGRRFVPLLVMGGKAISSPDCTGLSEKTSFATTMPATTPDSSSGYNKDMTDWGVGGYTSGDVP